ncbi:MAG: molecular chaperone TorD family protein [Hyphomicrobiaceae bacterium]|nr:molecular chaperone TorD family protein [Hyphomicrobiaceae bacterium]
MSPVEGGSPLTTRARYSSLETAALLRFTSGVADDIEMLASLHDREPTRAIVDAVRSAPIEEQLALRLRSDEARNALSAFATMVSAIPADMDDSVMDDFAAGYADVYLRHTYRAAPTESVWMTEDGLERQAPMFRVRDWYRRHGLVVADTAGRPDDHIVLQLRFVAHLLREKQADAGLGEAARFMDAHILRWSNSFAARLVHAGAPDWYAALALLTACYLDELRLHLASMTGLEAALPESKATPEKSSEPPDAAYIPGVAPSW